MNAEFSEFSYGYAMTDNIMHSGLVVDGTAPVFPSLRDEGGRGGGYDVKIPARPVPLFFQFKVPYVITRRSRLLPENFIPPYMRMPVRTAPINQHTLLLELESDGNRVFYATPDFWKIEALDDHYRARDIPEHSRYFSPRAMGPLYGKHYVAYTDKARRCWLYSKPRLLEEAFDIETLRAELHRAMDQAKPQDPLEFLGKLELQIEKVWKKPQWHLNEIDSDYFPQVYSKLEKTGKKKPLPLKGSRSTPRKPMSPIKKAARDVAYLAQVRLGCAFAVIGHD